MSLLRINEYIIDTTGNYVFNKLDVTANLTAGNANLGNLTTSNYFVGNGSLLTGISAGSTYANSNVADYLPTYTGNLAAGNANISGSITTGSGTGNISGANYVIGNYFSGNGSLLTSLIGANVTGYVPLSTAANTAATVTTAAQPNITSVGSLTSLVVSGDATVAGNLTVSGNTEYTNVTNLYVKDPIIEMGGGANGAVLSSNDGKDRGTLLHYYTTSPVDAFMGWDNSNSEFGFGSNVSISSEVVTFNNFGNIRAGYFIGNGATLTSVTGANVTGYVPNANIANTATTAGTVTTGAQPNITSVGTLSSLTVSGLITATGTGIKTSNIQDSTGTITITTRYGNIAGDVGVYGNLTVGTSGSGNVTASYFIGDGSLLTGISGTYSNTNVADYLPTYTGNLAAGNANVSGTMSVASITTTGSAGNITGANYINANFYIGNGSLLTGLPASYSNTNVADYLPTYTGNLAAGNANISGSITTGSGTGNISGANYINANFYIGNGSLLTGLSASYSNTNVAAYLPTYTGNLTAGNANISGNLIAGNLTTSGSGGNLSGANYVISNYFIGDGSLLTSITGANVTGYVPLSTTANIAGTVTTASQPNITSTGTLLGLSVTGNLNITGNINVTGNLNYSNVTDLVVGDPLIYLGANNTGNLYDLGIVASYTDSTYYHTGIARDATDGTWKLFDQVVAEPTTVIDFANGIYAPFRTGSFTSTGNITSVNATLGNLTTSNYFVGNGSLLTSTTGANVIGYVPLSTTANTAGTVTTNNQPNITSVGTLTSLTVTGNVSANYFIGNGALLTGISAGSTYANSNVADYLPTYTGNLSAGNANISGSITTGSGTGNISGADYVVANYFTGTLTTPAQPNITSVGNLTLLTVTGNVSANYFIGDGSQLTGLPASYSNTNVAAYLPTYTGNFTAGNANISGSLVTGTITTGSGTGNISGANYVIGNYFSGNGSLLTSITGANVTGYVPTSSTANTAATVTTSAQPNITSVGTLSSLLVSGDSTISGNLTVSGTTIYTNVNNLYIKDPIIEMGGGANNTPLSSNDGKDRGTLLHYYTTGIVDAFMGWDNSNSEFAFGSNVSVSSEVVTFNNFGNIRANYFIGNGATLTSVTGANVTGYVPLSTTANTAGTITTAAQPNITSIGTLTSVTVSGLITATGTGIKTSNIQDSTGTITITTRYGNIAGDVGVYGNLTAGTSGTGNVTASYFIGDGSQLTNIPNANTATSANTAATVTTNAQPNITSTGTLTSLSVSGNVDLIGANISLGSVSNLHITGGTANYVLATDGTGNLSWAAQSGGGASVAGSNTQVQFNDSSSFGASANFTFNKTSNTLTVDKAIHLNGANLGSNVSNLYIGGGGVSQILATDGSGNLTWIAQPTAVITVDNFTGNGVQTVFSLSTTPANINQTMVNIDGVFQLRTGYSLTGPNITFSEAPANGYSIEVTTTMGATSGAGAFITRAYTGTGSQANFTVTSGSTVSSVIVTENGIVQAPTTDYTISNTTLTFTTAPTSNVAIQIRELAIAIATTNAPVYRAYTGNGVANTFTITSGLSANSLIVAENGIIQRPTTDYSVSGSNVVFVSPPASNVDIQIRELSLNGGGTSSGISLPTQGGNSGKYLTTDGATASWANVNSSALTWNIASSNATMTASNGYFVDTSGGAKTMTLPSSATLGDTIRINDLAGSFSTNNLTVARNGHKIQGNTSDLLIDVNQSSFGLVYSNSTYGWKVLEL